MAITKRTHKNRGLEPMAEIPAEELWLYQNPTALKQVQKGLQQSKEGKVRKRGSFAQQADSPHP